ncbi:hypothetical protein SDC9_185718 [bioreactor metagenome]|uniref:Uncharacterized protein n=1 Tax=bioreactor metagenome TaxID=1076179 RepID=A0A645HPY7_9ZZZZ
MDIPAASRDDIIRRHRLWNSLFGHAVCRRGIKAVAGEEAVGNISAYNASVEKQSTLVGVGGAKFHVMADHNNGNALI